MAAKILKTNQLILCRFLINKCLKTTNTSVFYSSSVNVDQNDSKRHEEVIVIPKRIERGPTDILRALADITERDLTAPDYHFVDDPFLTPNSTNQKRNFALSRESGRRAARHVFEEFPELFFRDNSEPKVEAFTYNEVYDENTRVDETDLKKCILRKEVNHSMVCYQNLMRDSVEISSKTLQMLLELVCFYNCEEPPDFEFLIERSFMKDNESMHIVWKDNGFAEQLFASIEEKTDQMYCALIQGMVKHSQPKKAYQYYEMMIEKGLKLNVETYNSLIRCALGLRQSSEARWQHMMEVLNSMKNNGIKPNLQTMNTILEVIQRFGGLRSAQELAKKTLVEMSTKLGIEPSLATYHYIMNIWSKHTGANSPVLYEIMDRIDGKEFTIRDPKDVYFYVNAMSFCQTKTLDIRLAYRIHSSVNLGNNYKLLGNHLMQTHYYQHFFKLLSALEDLKTFMEIYDKYVPNVYIPEPYVMRDVVKSIGLYEGHQYLPKIVADIKKFEYLGQIELIEDLFQLLADSKVDNNLRQQFSQIVTDTIADLEAKIAQQQRSGYMRLLELTGRLLGYAIDVYLNDNDINSAAKVLEKVITEKDKLLGNPSPQTFTRLVMTAIDKKMFSLAKQCVKHCNELVMFEVSERVLEYVRDSHLDSHIKQTFEEVCDVSELMSSRNNDGQHIQDMDPIESKRE